MSARLLPLLGFIALLTLLGAGIWASRSGGRDHVPSPLIAKPVPAFSLPMLYEPDRQVSNEDLTGRAYLLNVFGSWCVACRVEHPVLETHARALGVPLVGLNYKDERDDALRWLQRFGDPYDLVIVDLKGLVAIDFGVYGAPETFVVDAAGIIRHKHIGPLTPEALETTIRPMLAQWQTTP